MSYKAYYSILQFCPDRSRAEGANIGVIVMSPETGFVDARTAKGNERVARFFGRDSFDKRRLNVIKRAIETHIREKHDWSQGLADLDQFIASRANDIQLTSPRSLKTDNPAAALEQLYHELVGGRTHSVVLAEASAVVAFAKLDDALRRPTLRDRIRFNESITVPVIQKTLAVPYAYQNGALNLVKPQRFTGSSDRMLKLASELAVEGDLLARHSTAKPVRLVVIPVFSQAADDAQHRVSDLFGEYDVRVVPETEIEALVTEIEATAH